MLLSNRVAIITGGAKGIGRSTALKFAEEGCSVAIADISMAEANDTVAAAKKKGVDAIAVNCDVTNRQQVRDMVAATMRKFNKIDILFNGAGGLPKIIPTLEMSEEDWDKVVALNLKSAFLFSQAVIPHMQTRKWGRIINISSIGALYPPASAANYNTAKAGIMGLTFALASEFASSNILVNAILPGPIRTDFWKERVKDDAFFAEIGKKIVPLQRAGAPEDIAGVALFLASDMASFITGEAIKVAGGVPLKPAH